MKFLLAVLLSGGIVVGIMGAAIVAVADSPPRYRHPQDRIADALERLADCSCMQVCNQRRCLGSSSSDNGGPLP
jgi:hypothetical protein